MFYPFDNPFENDIPSGVTNNSTHIQYTAEKKSADVLLFKRIDFK